MKKKEKGFFPKLCAVSVSNPEKLTDFENPICLFSLYKMKFKRNFNISA